MENFTTNVDEVAINTTGETAERHIVKIKSVENVTHNVLKITTTKPAGYLFTPGQATEISINKNGWEDEKRAFTFTSLPSDPYLEFVIKIYPEKNGVTNELLKTHVNDELIVHEVFGTISYKGEGIFIAGGAGVTPFIPMFKHLHGIGKIGNNILLCANKTKDDIILREYFESVLGNNFVNILSEEKTDEFHYGYISREFLLDLISANDQHFYICGPEPMMDAVEKHLVNLNVDAELIVKEQF